MMLKDLVLKNRSYRGFDESVRISRETLEGFVDCARLCPSSVNKQPLKYFLAWEPEEVEKVQGLTKWARALPEMVLPHPGKRPTGFVVICQNKRIDENLNRYQSEYFRFSPDAVPWHLLPPDWEAGLHYVLFWSFHSSYKWN